MRPDQAATSSTRTVPVYGPETWTRTAGVEWSWWDLWFVVVCVADHGGDWDALDAAIAESGRADRSGREAKWSHLLDLTERLRKAGLTAADLAGQLATDRATRTKARTKVMRSTLYARDLTPAMRNPPSALLKRRALFGAWPRFPALPAALVRHPVGAVRPRRPVRLGWLGRRSSPMRSPRARPGSSLESATTPRRRWPSGAAP